VDAVEVRVQPEWSELYAKVVLLRGGDHHLPYAGLVYGPESLHRTLVETALDRRRPVQLHVAPGSPLEVARRRRVEAEVRVVLDDGKPELRVVVVDTRETW